MLVASNEDAKERCMEAYREEKRMIEVVKIKAKRKQINSFEGRSMRTCMEIRNCFGKR